MTPDQAAAFDEFAAVYGRAERSLFAALRAGVNDLKKSFLVRFGLTSRQFNALKVGLDAKIASIRERLPVLIDEAEARIGKLKKKIARIEKKKRREGLDAKERFILHQKKRCLGTLEARLAAMKSDREKNLVRLCFGSRKLFREQFNSDRSTWNNRWREARSNQFFTLGSKDETAGNHTCQARITEDGSLTLAVRMSRSSGRVVIVPNVRFAYGHEAIVRALESSRIVDAITKSGKPVRKRDGTAVSYRFVRDAKGWRVFASVEVAPVTIQTRREAGAIGIDVNVNHLAVVEADRFGNLVGSRRIDVNLYGKSTERAKAIIGDAAVVIARMALAANKPVIIERLDFRKKKTQALDPRAARTLSSFAYSRTLTAIRAACFRAGVEVIQVNPAFSSVIGAVNFACRYGISIHQGAAISLARRGMGFSERPTARVAVVPTRNGGHVTFDLPVRNRSEHVWSHWSDIRKQLKTAHVAHARSGGPSGNPAPLSLTRHRVRHWVQPGHCSIEHVNRRQHCSADVVDELPF